MANLKPPDDAEQELCENCGLPPFKGDPTIPITLLFSKATRQVLCLEAGKDFVDTLMGFLTLPIGCIIKLLEEAVMIHKPEPQTAPLPPCAASPGLPYTPALKKRANESGEHFSLCSISNIFDSVVRLDANEMSTDKKCLVDPKPAIPFGAGKLLALPVTPSPSETPVSTEPPVNYGCGNACSFYTSSPGTKCPKHKKRMSVPFELVEPGASDANDPTLHSEEQGPDSARQRGGRACATDGCVVKQPIPSSRAQSRRSLRPSTAKPADAEVARPPTRAPSLRQPADPELVRPPTRAPSLRLAALPTSPVPSVTTIEPGYVREGTKYMITNTLDVHASSEAIKALIALNIIRCERVGDLDTMPVSVVRAEILQLLKSSFTSTNVLNDVFGKYCADANTVVFEEKKEAFFPQCEETPCCQCARLGTPLKGGQD